MVEPFKPIPFKDALGRRMVLVEVPKQIPMSPQVDLAHEHYFQLPGAPSVHLKHHHLVDLDVPEHIHALPKITSQARYVETHLKGARQALEDGPSVA
jgi:hypothetical protein